MGKSCILLRFTKEEFKGDYNVTIGVDFANKTIKLDQDTTVKLQIWDTVIIEILLFFLSFSGWTRSFWFNH